MARTVRNQKLDTRSARAKLPANKSGYWVPIAKGCAVGYRKGPKGSAWLAKVVRRNFRRELGPADDVLDADGVAALGFSEAQEKARRWFKALSQEAAGVTDPAEPYTVAVALADYLADYQRRGGKADAALFEVLDRRDEVGKGAAQPVEPPNDYIICRTSGNI